MSMLEKLAERVREEAKGEELSEIPCFICPAKESFSSACNDMHLCPVLDTDEVKSLTFARWAVKLVAEGLTPQIDEWERHIKGAQDGLTESDLLKNVAYKLLDLITEASEKQAEEGADGR